MSEPKVVHEYEAVGTKIRVTEEDGKHLRWMLYKGEWCCDPTEDAEELARLAARVQELEDDVREGVEAQVRYVAEITRLREALGEYGHHKPHCKLDPCDCGILEALKEKS